MSRQDLKQKTVSQLQTSDELGQVTWICQTMGGITLFRDQYCVSSLTMLGKAAGRGESYAVMVDTHQKCIIVTHPEIYFKDGNKNFELTNEECPMAYRTKGYSQ